MIYGTLTYSTYQSNDTVHLTLVECKNIATGERHVFKGSLREIFSGLTLSGIDILYVLNGNQFFGFIDYLASKENLQNYDDLNDNTGLRKRISAEAVAIREGTGQSYSRKIWLYGCKANTRHKRLHNVTFMNFATMVGGLDIDGLLRAFQLPDTHDELDNLTNILRKFNLHFKAITGEYFLRDSFPAAWTMGGAARSFYLKLRYPDAYSRLKLYQISHPQDIELEYRMRTAKLLIPGLLYLKDFGKPKFGTIFKYDVNSLFAATEKQLPDLGKFKESNFKSYQNDREKKYEYVFILNSIVLKAKPGMPRIFSSPFETYCQNSEYVSIDEEWAVYAPFLECLKNFYDIVEMDIAEIYRAPKFKDLAIEKYVDILDKQKQQARRNNNEGLASIAKFFIVNLHGKFAQKTVSEDIRLNYNADTDTVEVLDNQEIKEEWNTKHFDYMRGAYIYTMARVNIMKLMLEFKSVLPQGDTLEQHIFYDDTDSIITDLKCPESILSPYALGKLKLEEIYSVFEAIAPKTYWGRQFEGNNVTLTCAGMDKEIVFKTICERYNIKSINQLNYEEIHRIFNDENIEYEIPVLTRMPGGNGYKIFKRALTAKNKARILL